MWFGRIVPLFRFPLIEGTSPVQQTGKEERTLPLPLELCVGMNTDQGTALYVTYGINPDHGPKEKSGPKPKEDPEYRWGDDLAGWMVIAPFPPRIFKSGKLMRLDVHLNNIPGAFREGVTQVVSNQGGTFLCMEVLGTGDMGSMILLPTEGKADELRTAVASKKKVVGGVLERKQDENDTLQLGWMTSLFSTNDDRLKPIPWAEDRRVLVRDRQITIPFGEFWFNYNKSRSEYNKNRSEAQEPRSEKLIEPSQTSNYCLLARDMEVPVLLALFPSRPLFRIDLDVSAETSVAGRLNPKIHQIGSGMLNEAVKELSGQKCNIWHVQNTYRSLLFESNDPPVLRAVDSRISIVASVPEQYKFDRPEVIASYLGELRRRLLRLRINPTGASQRRLQRSIHKKILNALSEAPTTIATTVSEKFEELLERVKEVRQELKDSTEGDVSQAAVFKLLRRVVDEHIQGILNLIEPSFVKNVDIHGPPLFRCFFSHSARPAYDERDHIDRLKLLLESEVFEVIEGEFSLGMSTEALSRGKIRHCDLFVSFLWPRDDFRTDKGDYMPPEWVIHEESFAIGQGMPVYRVRENSVMPPRYEQDRLDFGFSKGDMESWKRLEHQFRLEIRQLVQQILLGIKPAMQGKNRPLGS